MISKNIEIKHTGDRSSSFRVGLSHLLAYVEKGEPGVAVSEPWHLGTLSADTGDAEMLALVQANPNADLPMRHFVVSWPHGEIPTPEQVREAAEMMLQETGLEGCLAKCGSHFDTENVHLHVAVVTVDPDTLRMRKTAFLHEALQRFNAKLEHEQGWEAEEGARYQVNENGECVRIRKRDPDMSSKHADARAMEVVRGQRSATDIAQSDVGDILRDKLVNSWEEFHRALATKGMTYEKKGSGAVVGVMQDDAMVYVKASDIATKASMGSLVKRFGAFELREGMVVIAQRHVEPVIAMPAEQRKVWQEQNRLQSVHRSAKRLAVSEMRLRHREEREGIAAAHACERNELLIRDWLGLGFMRMAFQAVLAAKYKLERIKLRRKQADERSELRKKFSNQPMQAFAMEAAGEVPVDALPSPDAALFRDIAGRFVAIANPCRRDALVALQMHASCYSQEQIAEAIEKFSQHARAMSAQAEYARRLSTFPLSERGRSLSAKMLPETTQKLSHADQERQQGPVPFRG